MSQEAPGAATELVCEALGRHLAALSDAPLFGVAGSGNLELIAALRQAGGRDVAAGHEGGAVTMANGWAQAGRAVGLATLHHGPGVANAMTALVDAAAAASAPAPSECRRSRRSGSGWRTRSGPRSRGRSASRS